jgi:hypothetical protein
MKLVLVGLAVGVIVYVASSGRIIFLPLIFCFRWAGSSAVRSGTRCSGSVPAAGPGSGTSGRSVTSWLS